MSGLESRLLGRWGEERVADYLRTSGWDLLAAGWRCRFGEIDLIAEDRDYIAFVEVKLRKDARFAPARSAVDGGKRERLRTAAALYLAQNPSPRQPRFDVAEVYAPQGTRTPKPEIYYIEDAF